MQYCGICFIIENIIFRRVHNMSVEKEQSGHVSDPSFKANWSGFISQDLSKPINASRNDIFDQAKQAKARSWRDFMGDAMIYFFENSTAEELLELLTKNMYLDQRGYNDAAKTLGIDPETAKENYRKLTLK